ncbi:MAG TPA: RNA 2',3'-cyclic phosphodiesterase [Tepidisphaeraceae bacterium]|nr:RNA 2',3'-cyclic phosphodiesterase [Tepidisphaeraceae bacterium]
MRLFVAIPLPADARAVIRKFGQDHEAALPQWRWIRPDQLHVTLKLIGEVDDVTADGAKKALASVHAGEPFALRFAGLLRIPAGRNARVLACKLGGEIERLQEIQGAVEAAFARKGFATEERGFLPHVTIARRQKDAPAVATLKPPGPELRPPDKWFIIASIRLVRSNLQSAGAEYETLLDIPLVDPLTLR